MTKEQIAAYNKSYREANRESIAVQRKVSREANKENIAAYGKVYRKVNKEKTAAYNRAYYRRAGVHERAQERRNRPKERAQKRKGDLQRKYGLTLMAFESMLASQGNACVICHKQFVGGETPHVDHDHVDNHVRGILCGYCNTALGLLQDSPTVAQSAVAYLLGGSNVADDYEKVKVDCVPDVSADTIFINHIQSHLGVGQVVVCKICGKSAYEIIGETRYAKR